MNELIILQNTLPYLSLCGRFLVRPLLEEDHRLGPVESLSTPGRSKIYCKHVHFYNWRSNNIYILDTSIQTNVTFHTGLLGYLLIPCELQALLHNKA
jgi:hypothetical protein